MEPKIIEHWINGSFHSSSSDRFGDIFNPASGEVISKLPMGNKSDLEKTVTAAEAAYASWSKTSITKRAQVMFKFKELLESHREELTELITL